MKIGVLTGGGDCPGLNAVIRAVVRKSDNYDSRVVGIRNGWKGLVGISYNDLDTKMVSGILHIGGTIIGTSRTNPFKDPGWPDKVLKNFRLLGLDALVAIGGEDTLGAASKLYERGLPVVGVPKTIDNDLSGTDFTFGFDTAGSIATDAIDRIHTRAGPHNRAPPQPREELQHRRGGGRGKVRREAGRERTAHRPGDEDRRVRARPAGRDLAGPCQRDRETDDVRIPVRSSRPHPAGRLTDRPP